MNTGTRTHIFIGELEILRSPRVWVDFVRHRPMSRAGVTLPDPLGEYRRSISDDDAVEIRFGYLNEDPTSWKGTVAGTRPGNTKDQIEILVVGEEKPLSTRMTESFIDETPEAIIRHALKRAGLEVGRIDSPGVIFPHFVVSTIPVWQVARQCEHTCQKGFDIDMSKWALWMDVEGKINWGDFEEDGDIPLIETGENLIKHYPAQDAYGLSFVETFLHSGFRSSRKFHLRDTRRGVDEELRALTVRHLMTGHQARTHIGYGNEYVQC